MLSIVPREVVDLPNEQSGALKPAARVAYTLPQRHAIPDTASGLTPVGQIVSDLCHPSPDCPRCGSTLGTLNLYVGGRGYLPYIVCTRFECDYQRRAN